MNFTFHVDNITTINMLKYYPSSQLKLNRSIIPKQGGLSQTVAGGAGGGSGTARDGGGKTLFLIC